MPAIQETSPAASQLPETQNNEAKFWAVTPGAVCLSVTDPSMAEPLQFKAGLESRGIDCELTIHRLHPAGWQSNQGHTEADSSLALFVMPNVTSRADALRTLTETGRYKDRTISGWTEQYHPHIVRNNPSMTTWLNKHPEVPSERIAAFAELLTTPPQAPEGRSQVASERRLPRRSVMRLARVALQRLAVFVA